MAGKSDIEAGSAFVRLYVKGKEQVRRDIDDTKTAVSGLRSELVSTKSIAKQMESMRIAPEFDASDAAPLIGLSRSRLAAERQAATTSAVTAQSTASTESPFAAARSQIDTRQSAAQRAIDKEVRNTTRIATVRGAVWNRPGMFAGRKAHEQFDAAVRSQMARISAERAAREAVSNDPLAGRFDRREFEAAAIRREALIPGSAAARAAQQTGGVAAIGGGGAAGMPAGAGAPAVAGRGIVSRGLGAAAAAGPAAAMRVASRAVSSGASVVSRSVGAMVGSIRGAIGTVPSLGSAMQGLGMKLAIGGASLAIIAAPLGLLTSRFGKIGTELGKMSADTGVSVEKLSALKFAATQSGQSFEELAKQAKAAGGKITPAMLKQVGMGSENEMMAKAGEAGALITKEQANDAKMLGDTWGLVKREITATVDTLTIAFGGAIAANIAGSAERVRTMFAAIRSVSRAAGEWIKNNKGLFSGLATGLSIVGGVAAGLVVVGGVLGVVGTAMATLGSVAATAFSPFVVGTALVVGGAAAWLRWTKSGKSALASVTAFLAPFAAAFKTTFGGIMDALRGGDLSLAAQIGMAGLRVVVLTGVSKLVSSVDGQLGNLFGTIGKQLATGDFSGAWDTAVKGMATVWAAFTDGITSSLVSAAKAGVGAWKTAVDSIANYLLSLSAEGGMMGAIASKVLGVDMSEEQIKKEKAKRQQIQSAETKNRQAAEIESGGALSPALQAYVDTVGSREKAAVALRLAAADMLRAAGAESGTVLEDAMKAVDQQTAGTANPLLKRLDELAKRSRDDLDAAAAALVDRTKGGSDIDPALAAAQADLQRLRDEAAKKAAKARKAAGGPEGPEGPATPDRAGIGSFVTSSGAAAVALVGRGSTETREEKRTRIAEKQLEIDRAMLANSKDALAQLTLLNANLELET